MDLDININKTFEIIDAIIKGLDSGNDINMIMRDIGTMYSPKFSREIKFAETFICRGGFLIKSNT